MEISLARQLLRPLLEWDEETELRYLPRLVAMAEWKWDGYAGFRAGRRFLESLVWWLRDFPDPPTRMRWLTFVADDLIFISSAEIDHLVSVAFPDVIRPAVLAGLADRDGVAPHLSRRIRNTAAFRAELRRILIVGLSDGARIDLLRRNADGLSNEQFATGGEIPQSRRDVMSSALRAALQSFGADVEPTFNHVVLVDDFYGSGSSLIEMLPDPRCSSGQRISGKIEKFIRRATELATAGRLDEPQLLSHGFRVTVLLYVASARAARHIRDSLELAGLTDRWHLQVIQTIADHHTVTDQALLSDCAQFWDPTLEDEHKKRAARGFRDCALPIVLHHNAPNNSVCPLWADSVGPAHSLNRHALFPRYERDHADRP